MSCSEDCGLALCYCVFQCFIVILSVGMVLTSPFLPAILAAILLLFYLVVRTIEFFTYWNVLGTFGDWLAKSITYMSVGGITSSWIGWLIMMKVHGLKHHVLLDIELIKWVPLCLIFLAFCLAMLILRRPLAWVREVVQDEPARIFDGLVGIYECVIFIVAELAIMKHAPTWKDHHALGFNTWKLVQKLVLILLAVVVIKTTTRFVVLTLQVAYDDRKHVVYFAKRMRKSINVVCFSILWIILWLSYFRPRFKHRGVLDDRALDFLDWGFFCLAIGAVFWLMKKFVVLKWEAHVVYDRFQKKILQAGLQFYLFQLLVGIDADSKFSFWVKLKENRKTENKNKNKNEGNNNSDNNENKLDAAAGMKQKAKEIFVQFEQVKLPTYQLQRMVKYLRCIDEHLPSLEQLIRKIPSSFGTRPITSSERLGEAVKDVYNSELDSVDAETLYEQIRNMHSKGAIEAKDFERWAVKAYRNCSELSNTLEGAKEVAKYLNKLLGGFLLVLVILIWLLATKIAKTDLLVLISSPILAATFIFGDTCKNIFEGIIFAFVMHLFDVGDVCVVEGIQMEVIRIGIWKTTFQKVDTKEQMIYQNSSLLGMVIVKRKAGLKLSDFVEYSIAISEWDPSKFRPFTTYIDECLGELKCEKHPLGVLVKEVGDKVKLAIHFKHQPGLQDMIHHDCYKQHSITRAQLLLKVKDYFHKVHGKSST